jgi:hypothetical protein
VTKSRLPLEVAVFIVSSPTIETIRLRTKHLTIEIFCHVMDAPVFHRPSGQRSYASAVIARSVGWMHPLCPVERKWCSY